MSDELDDLIAAIELRVQRGPDPIDAALTSMSARLAEKGENHLHSLLHFDPGSLYVGLSNSRDGAVEVSGQGYARQSFGQTQQNVVKFPAASGSWGTIEAVVIFSEGTAVVALPMDVAKTVQAGDSLQVHLNLMFP
jgi:hypothetical protein